jgi:hypothetical protein
MARRQVSMNEIVEMVYQWHQGRSIQGIERSFGTDRKTIRKYVRLAQVGFADKAFPEEADRSKDEGCWGRRDAPEAPENSGKGVDPPPSGVD